MTFSDDEEMYVTKINGEKEIVSFDKILQRIKKAGCTLFIPSSSSYYYYHYSIFLFLLLILITIKPML